MDSTGYRIQFLLSDEVNMENTQHARTSSMDSPERTAPVAVDGSSYGGPPDRRVSNMVVRPSGSLPLQKPYDCSGLNSTQVAVDGPSYGGRPDRRITNMVNQLGGLPLHKPYDYLRMNSYSQNLTSGSASGYGNVSTCESFRNANSDGWNWYTPDVGRNSSLDVELRSQSPYSGRIPARAITGQDEEDEDEEDTNTQLRPTTSGHGGYRTSATTLLNSINTTQHFTRVRIVINIIK